MNRRSVIWLGIAAIALATSLLLGYGGHLASSTVAADIGQLAQAPEEELPILEAATSPVISGTYQDPQGNFQVGILEGFSVNSVGGAPLFQNADGSLAYSVVSVPLSSANPLPDIGLVELARQVLDNGEGFQTQTFSSVAGGGLQIAWTGRLSQGGGPPQPVAGTILAKQQGENVYLMVVAALDTVMPQVPPTVSVLSDTLTIL
jgi:hypothetical protein